MGHFPSPARRERARVRVTGADKGAGYGKSPPPWIPAFAGMTYAAEQHLLAPPVPSPSPPAPLPPSGRGVWLTLARHFGGSRRFSGRNVHPEGRGEGSGSFPLSRSAGEGQGEGDWGGQRGWVRQSTPTLDSGFRRNDVCCCATPSCPSRPLALTPGPSPAERERGGCPLSRRKGTRASPKKERQQIAGACGRRSGASRTPPNNHAAILRILVLTASTMTGTVGVCRPLSPLCPSDISPVNGGNPGIRRRDRVASDFPSPARRERAGVRVTGVDKGAGYGKSPPPWIPAFAGMTYAAANDVCCCE